MDKLLSWVEKGLFVALRDGVKYGVKVTMKQVSAIHLDLTFVKKS